MIHHVTKATRHLIFWSLLFIAISLSGVRLLLTGIDSYKANLETRISALVGAPVKVGGLTAKMRGVSPELVLSDINIESVLATEAKQAKEKSAIHLKEIHLGINLGEFLVNRDVLASSWITLVGAKLSIYRKPNGDFIVEGLKTGNGQPFWLLQGRQYKVLHSQITWQDHHKSGKPLVLDDVNVAVINDGDHHRINVLTQLPKKYGENLKVVIDMESPSERLSDIEGKVFLEGSHVKLLDLVSDYLPNGVAMTAGSANFKLWSQWQHAKPIAMKGTVQLRNALFSQKNKGILPVNNLDTAFNLQIQNELINTQQIKNGLINDQQINHQKWHLDINRFLLESDGDSKNASKKWSDAIASFAGESLEGTGFLKLKMFAKQLDLAEIARLASFFGSQDNEYIKLLDDAHLKGQLDRFSLFAEPQTKNFAIAGWFNSLGAEPLFDMPAFENMSGEVKSSDKIGKINLYGNDVVFKLPKLFNKPLPFKQVNGQLVWQQTEDKWTLTSDGLNLQCPAFASTSRFFVSIPKTEEKPFIDLQTAFKSDDLSQIANYLPTEVMKEKLKTWMSNAFVGGKLNDGNLLFYGNVDDYPFTNGAGVFEAEAELADAELKYHPHWPTVSNVDGKVSFTHNTIEGSFTGKSGNAEITKASAQITHLGVDDLLTIKGEGQGEISQFLDILQQSPLAARVSPFTKGATVQGTTKATLDMTIPLRPGHEIQVDGVALLKNANLTFNQLGLKVSKIKGDLKFNKQGIYGDGIQAFALAHPLNVDITQDDQKTLVTVDGKARVIDIERVFALPKSSIAEGEGDYQLQLEIPKIPKGTQPIQVSLKSTLEGVALQLPGTLAKTQTVRKPTLLSFTLGDDALLPIELNYNNELKAALSINIKERKLHAGHVLIGTGTPRLPKIPGLKLEINKDQLPLQDWLGLSASQQQAGKAGLDFREIKLFSNSAMWKKISLGSFDLLLQRQGSDWTGEIDSIVAKGKFQLPIDLQNAYLNDLRPITLNMDMLNLSILKQLNREPADSNSSKYEPLLAIHSKKTLWHSEDLGKLTLETQRTPQGMLIKRLELEGEDAKLISSGEWQRMGINSTTTLKGQLKMKRADQFFDKLNITKDLTDTSGKIDFNINWHDKPLQFSLPDLRGTMDVSLDSGRLLSIEPGFGRILGILAVAQWFKRLQLDFSDIYEEGLTFNSITGHFDLLGGKAKTQNLFIDAIPAKITITGDTDLVKQTVDHVIKVVPKSLEAVPIAGTIMGKIAAVVGKSITGKDQEGFFFGTQYLVKGGWNDTKISALHENDGIFQKTWNGITDFPWAEQK
ncbi:MAG: YhdP family protein [Methyloglobulus sp.]|nr:TIGR02099 family protein [Methyloglobulus sp.]